MEKTKETKVKLNPSDGRDPKKSKNVPQRSAKVEAFSKAFIESLKKAGDDAY
jgi:hypothetical protein